MRNSLFRTRRGLAAGVSVLFCSTALAQGPALFKDADLALGEKLIAANGCNQCHARQVGGDGTAIYRPEGSVRSARLLLDKVEMCSHRLQLSLFPDEIKAIAAVLNRDHYHFK